ncbi:MAG: hypothetical protein M0P97_03815, partial [Candidatus Moranbacteria bacterium]|nr:hypothetical protein [Candidatus Moranbacteria bacterium]
MLLLPGLFFACQSSSAAIEKQVEISGYISNNEGNEIDNGEYAIRFAIYSDLEAGAIIWEETQTLAVVNGIFSTSLGSVSPFPDSLNFDDKDYYLGIKIGSDSEMSPRKKMGAVPLAVNSMYLNGATVGTGEGDILQLEKGGKINIDQLPVGTKKNTLALGDDSRFHNQNEDLGTNSTEFNIGDGASLGGNNFDLSVSGAGSRPSLRYNGSIGAWQFSNDGSTFQNFSSSSSMGSAATGGTGIDTSSSTGVPTISSGVWSVDSILDLSLGGTGLSSIGIGSLLFSESDNNLTAFQGLAADDGEYLTFNWNGGSPTLNWEVAAGSFTSFDIAGDSGGGQTISNGNTLRILGGNNITTVDSATDTVTINLDSVLTGTNWNGNVIASNYGGTGLSAYVGGDLLYYSSGTALSRLPIGLNGQIMGVVGGVPTWQNSPFVGAHNLLSLSHPDTTAASPLEGDLITGVDTGGGVMKWQRMAVGSAGQFLSNDGASLSWNDTSVITQLGIITTGTWNADVIDLAHGGTGLSTINQGSIIYADADDSLATMEGFNPDDGEYLQYHWNSGSPYISWEAANGSFTSFVVSGDGGIDQTVSNSNTLEITGGTNITTVGSDTDVLTINLDTTLSGITWNGNAIVAAYGGTGIDGSAAGAGTLLIGNGAGYTLANLTQGTGITITNGSG